MRLTPCLLVLLFIALPAAAEPLRLEKAEGLVISTDTGRTLTLPGLLAPDPALAAQLIMRLGGNSTVEAIITGHDRWGRELARITTADGRDLALELLSKGAAQLAPELATPGSAQRRAEDEARRPPRGLWQMDCCKLLPVAQAEGAIGSWRVISGRVVSVTPRRDLVFINFGSDWKTDFTLLLPARLAKSLQAETWTGKNIEARGMVERYYGPAIKITTAAQIRLPDSP